MAVDDADSDRHADRRQGLDGAPGEGRFEDPFRRQIGPIDALGVDRDGLGIDLILGDCVVLENWTGGAGGEGKSFNKYSPEFKRWEQYWVDAQGSTTFFHGKLEGKNMVYYAETPQPDGSILKRRLTFFNLGPNKVRQFSQQTRDDGKTWQTEYDLIYVRKNSQAKL